MSAACLCDSVCPCHDNPLTAIERLGVDWRAAKLTSTELALVGALAPGGVMRPYAWLWERVRPGEAYSATWETWHLFTVHASRARPKLRAAGWTIANVPTIGLILERVDAVPLDQTAGHFARAVAAFLEDADRQRQVLEYVQQGATQAAAARAVGLTGEQLNHARKVSSAFDACVKDAVQVASRERANRDDGRLSAPVVVPAVAPAVAPEAASDERCRIETCGLVLATHPRCPDCGQLAGPGHELLALKPGSLCPACYETARRRGVTARTSHPVQWGDSAYA